MKWSRTFRLALFSALPVAVGGLSLTSLVSLNAGGGVSLGEVDLLPIAAGYDRRAIQMTVSGTPPPTPPHLRDARALSKAAIAQYPYDTGAWLRLAYLDKLEHGQLTAAGILALQRSYDLVAAEPDFGVWRVGFALENSQALPQPLRKSVHEEVTALWSTSRDRREIAKLATQLQNPAGRLSLALWINLLQAAAK